MNDTLRSIILVVALFGMIAYGHFLMCKIDKFIKETQKRPKRDEEKKDLSYIAFEKDNFDEDKMEEIRLFQQQHDKVRILVYDEARCELSELIERTNC